METQQAAHCKNLSLQHQQEKEGILQKHVLQVTEMTEQLNLEREQREVQEEEIFTCCEQHYSGCKSS